jgi:hypothetical protein
MWLLSLLVVENDFLLIYDTHDLEESVANVELGKCTVDYKIDDEKYLENHFVIEIKKHGKDGHNFIFAVENKDSLEKWKSYLDKVVKAPVKNDSQ